MLGLIWVSNKKKILFFVVFIFIFNFFNIICIANNEDRPDLIIYNIMNPPTQIIEGEKVEFIVKIKNIINEETGERANISSGTNIVVALLVDDSIVTTNNTLSGLNFNEITYVNLSWTANLGAEIQRKFTFWVDYPNNIIESNENNNDWDLFINVHEKETDLTILNIDITDKLIVNKTTQIIASIKNNGKDSGSSIYAILNSSEEGKIETIVKNYVLHRNETYNFYFNWTPSNFGSQKISVDIMYNSKTHDYKEKTVIVDIETIEWWNENWHYRYFFSVNGSGDVSKNLNFTEILNDINAGGEFENDRLRIVKYNKSGDFINVIKKYEFKESQDFNKVTNAKGTLTWNVTGNLFEKYYCIYFDVAENVGDRDELIETPGMNPSGNATIGYLSFINGWWIDSLKPENGSYCLIEECINIIATTNALAENVSAYIFFNENESHNSTIYLSNSGDYTSWSYEDFKFDSEGNWTIRIKARDWIGYSPEIIEHSFFVGKPDIATINLNFSTNWQPTSPKIYRNDTVNITAIIISNDANIESVEISLKIISAFHGTIHKDETSIDLIKGKNKYITFNWKASISGDFNVIVKADSNNEVDEEDETNNELVKNITVYEWPDLTIVGITLPSEDKTEFERVQIDVIIKNVGLADAKDYEIRLFLEQDVMTYSNEVDSKLVNVNMNTTKTISLYWESAVTGKWLVASKINVTDTKRDTNIVNNKFLSKNLLTIHGIERYPPRIIIENVTRNQEQGEPVLIFATITDESGIESVAIKISDPKNKSYTNSMIRITGNIFKYEFKDTYEAGRYTYKITAIDLTIHRNTGTTTNSFYIAKDSILPIVTYYLAEPFVQLKGEEVNFYCITSDNVGIQSVKLIIESPVSPPALETNNMKKNPKDTYVFSNSFDKSGKYSYYVTVTDYADGKTTTVYKTFWITSSLDDTDDDGIPDWWERKYGLDPEDPDDANLDLDKDGVSNLKEYKAGTNPSRDIFIENVALRVKDNIYYLIGSIIMFLLIVIIPYFDKWRKSR